MHYFQIRINYVINITRLKKTSYIRIFFPPSTLIFEFSSLTTFLLYFIPYTLFLVYTVFIIYRLFIY
ncbi:hypothetical protein C2G38_2105631 [Gigaspora rosea]|uniref:Uncharacterized protein n=1 Tax=Gigaspora rosea TaxID=44941 RepID=A0A397UK21_9GLOM|nr:hypothetical protein C2G38_2105631 [Gigaspora rosea]